VPRPKFVLARESRSVSRAESRDIPLLGCWRFFSAFTWPRCSFVRGVARPLAADVLPATVGPSKSRPPMSHRKSDLGILGVIKFCRSRINRRTFPNIKWVQEWYFAPLDRPVLDEPIRSRQDGSRVHRLRQGQSGQNQHGSPGNGSTPHVSGELFKMMAGVNLVHVPYRGAGPALVDLLAGQELLDIPQRSIPRSPSTREKNRVGVRMISSPAETPSAWVTTSTSGQRALHCGHLERVVGHFFELGVVNRNSSG
jgi:Tripartite tricarboxylate transporter family receptor